MIRSPGAAASIAPWIVPEAATWKGALPPTVTLTASTDCLPLPAVTTRGPQPACDPPYCRHVAVHGSAPPATRTEEHTSEHQSRSQRVCRVLFDKKYAQIYARFDK